MDETTLEADPDRLLTPDELARLVGVSRKTVDDWRRAGKGPAPVYLTAQTIRYRRRDVLAWIDRKAAD